MRTYKLVNVILLAAFLSMSCGYAFLANAGKGISVAASAFSNSTLEPGLGEMVVRRVKDHLFSRTRFNIINSEKDADFYITGDVLKIKQDVISVSSDGKAREYRLTITCRIAIHDNRNNKVLLQKIYVVPSEYNVKGDVFVDMAAKERAIGEISAVIAEQVATAMLTAVRI